MIDVSIILVNYNTCELTRQCICSINEKSIGFIYEIIVVDNSSTDDSPKVLPLLSNVIYIESGANLGFGMANNLGAKVAKGKYIFLLNTDTILMNNAVKFLLDYYENNCFRKSLGAIGCWLMNGDMKITTSYSNIPSVWDNWKHIYSFFKKRIYNSVHSTKNYKEFEVGVVSGADLFIKKDIFLSIEGFDSNYFMYGEESELQYRLSKLGYRQFLIHEPSIVHLEGASSGNEKNKKASYFIIYHMKRGRFIFFRKHKLLITRLLLVLLDFPIDLVFVFIDKRFNHQRMEFFKLYSILFSKKPLSS